MAKKKSGAKRPNPSTEVENKSQEIVTDISADHGVHHPTSIVPASLLEVSRSVLCSPLPGDMEIAHILSSAADGLDESQRRNVRRRLANDVIDAENGALSAVVVGGKGAHRVSSVVVPGQVSNINMSSVVKVFCVHTEPNFSLPWQRRRQCASTGSGFVITGRRIVTNAHCVEHYTQVKVNRRGSDKKYLASVLAVGTECDIALLTVDDDEFWEGSEPLEFGQLPHLQDAVTVVGYPIGGDTMSVSSGVVSRIEVTPYTHGAMELLAVQIDAAINPGNSGGPAFNDEGKCVGVAFQSLKHEDAENIGYIIPAAVVEHFITDYERNGRYTGFPILGVEWQKTENVDLRHSLGMDDSMKGVMIRRVEPTCPANEVLRQDDVLLSFDGIAVSNDGTVPFRNNERISFTYLISTKYPGESVRIEVLQKGERKEYTVKLEMPYRLIPFHIKGLPPTYFIIAGLVFTTLTVPYLRSEYGSEYEYDAPLKLLQKMAHKMADHKNQQVLVLSQVLAAEVNIGYEDLHNTEVKTFNGEKVQNMEHLVRLVDGNTDPYLNFGLDYNIKVALNTQKAKVSTPDILALHCIPSDRSVDLRGTPVLASPVPASSSAIGAAEQQQSAALVEDKTAVVEATAPAAAAAVVEAAPAAAAVAVAASPAPPQQKQKQQQGKKQQQQQNVNVQQQKKANKNAAAAPPPTPTPSAAKAEDTNGTTTVAPTPTAAAPAVANNNNTNASPNQGKGKRNKNRNKNNANGTAAPATPVAAAAPAAATA